MPDDSRFRVDDDRFGESAAAADFAEPAESFPSPKRRSLLASCMMGCFVTFLVVLVLVAIAAYWLSKNWREMASNLGAEVIKQGINETELPPREKDEIGEQIDRVADAFRARRLSDEQMIELFQTIVESPLMTTLAVSVIDAKYVSNSGLSDEEKTAARATLQRYLRGAIDGEIGDEQIDVAMRRVADRQPDGSWRLRDQVSDEELRAFLKTAQEQSDAAGVAAEIETVDPSDEFKRIVDEALAPVDVQELPAEEN